MDIKELATLALKEFKVVERKENEYIYVLKDHRDEDGNLVDTWVDELVRDAHGDFFPDDYRYKMIHDVLEIISESDDPEDAIYELEPDVYTHELLKWISSNLNRMTYADEVLEQFEPKTLSDVLMLAQKQEIEEIGSLVLAFLENLDLDDYEDDSEDESEEEA